MADTLLGGIAINEILADPNGTSNYDTDGSGTAEAIDEYIELVNTSTVAIDISGLELWDAGLGNWFTFPEGTILHPGAHALVMSGVQSGGSLPTGDADDLFFEAGRASALINNGGDNVVVYDPANDEYISATFNGDALDDPTLGEGGYSGFSSTATQSGAGEDFGYDIDGYSLQRAPDGSDAFVNDQTPTPGTSNICFTNGTLFDTPTGPKLIEYLRPGDMLQTFDKGPQKIQWICARKRTIDEIARDPKLKPVRIKKNALGDGLPRRDLFVSQHHRIFVASDVARRMFGKSEILVPAKDLTGHEGIDIVPASGDIVYYHILLEAHEILIAEGVPAESLYLGPGAIKAIEPAALDELHHIFHAGIVASGEFQPEPARLLVKGKRVRNLVDRHCRNRRPLVNSCETSSWL